MADGCRYCGRLPIFHEGCCHDCIRRVMARYGTPPHPGPCRLPGCTVCPKEDRQHG